MTKEDTKPTTMGKKKVIAINGSPRRNWNTAKLCQAALDGAAAAGAETELIHLESMKFKGCMSCFACHTKKHYDATLCFYKDELTPVLEKCLAADAIIIGSPIYYGFATGDVRAFMERLMFPLDTYVMEDGKRPVKTKKLTPTALIYTMNANIDQIQHGHFLEMNERELRRIFGYCESYFACDTCQFSNYEPYAANLFDPVHKKERLEKQFPLELENCFELGKRLVEKALEV
jgi:putative NADPH-quinone reductase